MKDVKNTTEKGLVRNLDMYIYSVLKNNYPKERNNYAK